MTKLSPNTYSFKDFTLDLDRACLLRMGEEIRLRPKVFEALKYLVENRNRLITKEELIKAIWADTFVTDDSLVQCLVEIRRALGEEAQGCIKTVPRRGYIFEAPVQTGVELLNDAPILQSVPEPISVNEAFQMKQANSSKSTLLVALMAVAGTTLAIFFYFKLATTPPVPALTDK